MPHFGGSYSTSDLSRKSGDIIAEALRRPVAITQRGKPRLVLLNIENYEHLVRQSDARPAGAMTIMPGDLSAELGTAVDAYAAESEGGKP